MDYINMYRRSRWFAYQSCRGDAICVPDSVGFLGKKLPLYRCQEIKGRQKVLEELTSSRKYTLVTKICRFSGQYYMYDPIPRKVMNEGLVLFIVNKCCISNCLTLSFAWCFDFPFNSYEHCEQPWQIWIYLISFLLVSLVESRKTTHFTYNLEFVVWGLHFPILYLFLFLIFFSQEKKQKNSIQEEEVLLLIEAHQQNAWGEHH